MNAPNRTTGPVNGVLALAGIGLVVSLAVALMSLMSQGHAAFNTGSSGVTWGLPVVNYVFFALTSTGLTLVASLALVFGLKAFYPIAKRCIWLSLACIVAGFASLALEMGNPLRMIWAIPLNFQYESPLLWMGVFYGLFLVLGLLKFRKINSGDWDSSGSRTLGIAALTAEVFAALTLGAAFGMMAMRPFWYGPEVPLNFLLSGATTGAALAVLITYVAYGSLAGMPDKVRSVMTGPMPKVLAGAVALFFLMTLYRTINGLWSNADGLQVWQAIVQSPLYWLEMAALVVAFVVLVSPDTRSRGSMQVTAALLTLVAAFIGRYEFVVGGQLVPMFKGAWVPGLIDYAPSLTEWMLTLLAVSITFLVYAVGERMFDLSAMPKEARIGEPSVSMDARLPKAA
jgi:molybdopterin-containing oxidoreductase family membrane subunit